MRLADEGRNQRHGQQQHQPRRIHQQPDREADHGDAVLHLAEQLAHQAHAAHGLAARAVELVLQVGILEVLEVERRGMFHQPDAGGVGEQFRQQPVAVADHPAEQVGADRQRELQREQAGQRGQLAAGPGGAEAVEGDAGAGQPHGFIDDQLADVQRRDGQERADDPQAERGQRQRRAGRPDLPEERRQVAQRVEAVAQARLACLRVACAFAMAQSGAGVGVARVHLLRLRASPSRAGRSTAPPARPPTGIRSASSGTIRTRTAHPTGSRSTPSPPARATVAHARERASC